MATKQPGARQSGFTLLDVLVALVVLGLLMVGLTQGVRAGLALRQAQIQRLSETAELDAAMRLLRTLLTRLPVVPGGFRVLATENGDGFRGEADRVSFVGDLPTGLGRTRRADLTLYLHNGRLVLSWTPHRHQRSLAARQRPTETELVQGVERLDLAYWGSPGKGQPASWEARWGRLDAPELIRLRLGFPKGDRRRWPDLITAPRL